MISDIESMFLKTSSILTIAWWFCTHANGRAQARAQRKAPANIERQMTEYQKKKAPSFCKYKPSYC